jgi:hypothetical protein
MNVFIKYLPRSSSSAKRNAESLCLAAFTIGDGHETQLSICQPEVHPDDGGGDGKKSRGE